MALGVKRNYIAKQRKKATYQYMVFCDSLLKKKKKKKKERSSAATSHVCGRSELVTQTINFIHVFIAIKRL